MMVVTAGALVTLTLEALKWIIRKILKNPTYDFPVLFYELVIPFLAFIWNVVLGLAGWADPVAFDWSSLAQWFVAIIVALALYTVGIKPFKNYAKRS